MKKNINSIITSSDARAVNFREIRMGKIAPKTLYRSSHPIKENKEEKVISILANNARIMIIDTEGPWLIHCHAGVDRTGFVSMVLESFMGASLNEVINDYLLSFNSIFDSSIHISNNADSQTAMQILSVMSNSMLINEQNLQQVAEIYLHEKIGLSPVETELLKTKLAGEKNL
jgi:protein tyrosine/serine phosphatase